MFLIITVSLSEWRLIRVCVSTRNRPTASCSEGPPTKRPALSDGGPSDAEDVKGNSGMSPAPMPLCSQSSINSKEGMVGCGYSDTEMRD